MSEPRLQPGVTTRRLGLLRTHRFSAYEEFQLVLAGVALCAVSLVSAQARAGTAGTVASDGGSGYAAISASGRFVAFDSTRSNLVVRPSPLRFPLFAGVLFDRKPTERNRM